MNSTSGVYWFNGIKETYYSSKVLVHKDINEWKVDSEGCYRTSDGYYVVASQDYPKGTIIDFSKGKAKVLDYCEAGTGVLDVYVSWE